MTVGDTFGRPLKSLRLSVTDRCNLRCKYCMPEEEYGWLPRETLLSFEEIYALTDLFTTLGVDKVRLTGGEPLLRRNLPTLIRMLRDNRRIMEIRETGRAAVAELKGKKKVDLEAVRKDLNGLCVACHEPERIK